MTRRCSHCSNNGHNTRTCSGANGVKLFGVRLTDGSIIKKSASLGNLSSLHYHSSSSDAASPNNGSPLDRDSKMIHVSNGYLSDDTAHATCSTNRRGERKKGMAWTEEEHRMFLIGLQKIGKGDWRGISRNFVMSRTPTQVASHAQKYFIRHSNSTRRKRRSSLFDMLPDTAMDTSPVPEETREINTTNSMPSLNLSLDTFIPSHKTVSHSEEETISLIPPLYPSYLFIPFEKNPPKLKTSPHKVLKPIPILPKEAMNVDELVAMSRLNLDEPSPLSMKLLRPSRQSAFHVNTPVTGLDLRKGKSGGAIQTNC